jgi:predicted flap endonuclease-1-like 5' DNA nuclease
MVFRRLPFLKRPEEASMTRRLSSLLAIAALSSSLALSFSRVAWASHYAIGDIPSLVKEGDAEKLHKAGVNTTEDFLTKAAKAKDRKALAKASGLSAASVLDLARRCDLLRIRGVGPEMVLLLEALGVKTVPELAQKDAAKLAEETLKVNREKHLSEKPPTEPQFKDWIEQAKSLPPLIEGK